MKDTVRRLTETEVQVLWTEVQVLWRLIVSPPVTSVAAGGVHSATAAIKWHEDIYSSSVFCAHGNTAVSF